MTSSVWDWSTTAGSNTTVAGINIAEGCDPGNINNGMRAIMAAAKGASWGGTVGGTANALTGTLTPAPAAYAAGMVVAGIIASGNTGAATLNLNALGAKDIYRHNAALTGGEMVANNLAIWIYDGARFNLMAGGTGVIPERGTQQTTSSGTTFSFTGIPSWVTKIIIMFSGISFSSTDNLAVQIGDSGGTENTGYSSTSCAVTDASATDSASATNAFVVYVNAASLSVTGHMVLTLLNDVNRWISSHTLSRGASSCVMGGGTKALSGTLDRLTITRIGGGNFDAGSVNIWYE